MAVLNGIDFSPYVGDERSPLISAPEHCLASFFDRPELDCMLIEVLPEQDCLRVRPRGSNASERLSFDDVRSVCFLDPVVLKDSMEHLRQGGIDVHAVLARSPFSITFRNGQIFSGELCGYGATTAGLGLYAAADNGEILRYYFPRSGLESFALGDPLGKLLVRNGDLNEAGLNRALAAQKALRTQKLGDLLAEQRLISPETLNAALRQQAMHHPTRRIGEVMLEMGVLTQTQLAAALEEQKLRRDKLLGDILIDMGLLDKDALRQVLAHKLGIPHVALKAFQIDPGVFHSVPSDMEWQYKVVPLYYFENALIVAMANPMDRVAVKSISYAIEKKIIPVLASLDDIESVLENDQAGTGTRPVDR